MPIQRLLAVFLCVVGAGVVIAPASGQRSLGIDVSAWQGNLSQSTWNALRNDNDREFVFIRSSRGGTTGFYNQSDSDNSEGNNTLSQRYDDPYFVQNITRATAAGMLAGPYHFSRPDIVASTQNSGGIANTGADEADHFLQMAGAWMRPGYLLPVFDLEAGDGIRSDAELTQYSIDFSNRIYEVAGVRPIIYVSGNYAANVVQAPIQDYFPILWAARYPNQSDPDSIPVQTGHPKDSYSPFYGPWDDPPNPTHPWHFWQYASTARLSGFNNGNSNIDVNVAQGGTEFLRDQLVPALWVSGADGDWSSLANWNSGQAPVAPVQGPGQVPRVGPLTLPAARLPSELDTVILEHAGGDVAVTLSSGTHEVRKLVAREALTISGGSLTLNYTPVAESTPYSALLSAPVELSGGSLSAHTLHVDAANVFTLSGGALTFDTLRLTPAAANPAGLAITGDVTLSPLGATTTATIGRGAGSGGSGVISLGGAARVLTITDGAAAVDVSIAATITDGELVKAGAGVLQLSTANALSATTVNEGTLYVTNSLGTGPMAVAAGATLTGTGVIGGAATIDGVLAPGLLTGNPIGNMTIGSLEFQSNSTLEIEIGSAGSYDRAVLSGGLTIDPNASIDVTFTGGYAPAFGQSFEVVIGATGVSGDFGAVTTDGPAMVARSVAGGVVLEVLSGLAGDFNNDGAVDSADYAVWAGQYGGPASQLLNTDAAGTVDLALYTVWRDNEGATLAASGHAIPEPTAALLLLVSALAATAAQRGAAVA